MGFARTRRAPSLWANRSAARAAALASAGLLAGLGFGRVAAASPIDDPFVGGFSFAGPTSGDLGAIYWNPAALGLMRGFQIMVAGTVRSSSVTVDRAPIFDDGRPGGPRATGSATAHDFRQPFQWPPGPGSYVALGFGSDRFTLAFATYMPYLEQIHFPISSAGNEPTRYQMLSLDLRNLALVPALAIRFGNDLRVGLAPGFLFSTGSLDFAEDTALDADRPPCGSMKPCEDPAAAARVHVASSQGLGGARFSLTLGGGVYWRRRNFEFGVSYQSRPLASPVTGVEVAGQQSTVTLPPSLGGGPLTCAGGQTGRCVFGDATYRLPDVLIAGVTWHSRRGLELSVTARWLWLHLQDRIDIRLVSPVLDASGVPDHIVLHRGFHDVVDTRVRLAYWWHERVRIGGELRVETSAVDAADVNAAAVDGLKFEPVILAQLRLGRRVWLSGGYGLTIMPGVTVTRSAFDPTQATECAAHEGDLANPGCQGRAAGTARPTAAGTYTALTQDFGLTLNMKF
ncbi:MAG TPA: outer membrane protein transport protein [Polyangia bacterium]|nr:outer membrane protein transport protein [Polyangia bacterium]